MPSSSRRLLLGILVLALGLAFDRVSLAIFNVEFPRGPMPAVARSEPPTVLERIILEAQDMSPIASGIAGIGSLIIAFGLVTGFAGSARRRSKGERSASP